MKRHRYKKTYQCASLLNNNKKKRFLKKKIKYIYTNKYI